MKEYARSNIGNSKRQAEMTFHDVENKLWGTWALGEENPDQLRCTVFFLNGLNISLMAGDEYYALHRGIPILSSQLQF